jgi:hypothetical protein
MGFVAEGFDIEAAFATAQLAAQRRETAPIDMSRAQDESVGPFFQFDPVAGLHSQRFQNPRWESDLALGGDLD